MRRCRWVPLVSLLFIHCAPDVGETVMIESWNADGTSSVKYRGANWVAIHRQGVQPSTGPHRVAELVGNRLLVDPL